MRFIIYLYLYIMVIRYILYNNYKLYAINRINIIPPYQNLNKNKYNKRFFKKFNKYIIFKLDFKYY